VTGVDLTPRSIDIARRRFDIYGQRGEFLIGDGENLSFPDESFDVVYSFGVLHHSPDTAGAISEIRRVLRPRGKAIVMLYHRASLAYWGAFVFKHGILRGKLLRHSVTEIMSRHVEYGAEESRPLVKAYSRDEARQLFCDFSECEISVNQLTRRELRPFGGIVPEPIFNWLRERFGWNLLIKATK
jgi:ubiquinone/menaquinone biosynthesis C-methylase UbiE